MNFTRITAQSGVSFRLSQGQILEVQDPFGEQVSDLFCIDSENHEDILSSGRSIDYNDTIQLTTGHTLFGHSGLPMLKIIADTCGVHDFMVTPCSLQMFKMLDPTCREHPSCEANLLNSFAAFGIHRQFIPSTFNIFMNVPVQPSGAIRVMPPRSKAGDRIAFSCERDLIVSLTACSDEGTNRGLCKPIDYRIVKN